MRICKIVIALVLAVRVGVAFSYIASETVLLPGVELRCITNDRTGETANLFESLICYGFIWFVFNTLICGFFTIAISIAGAILGRCGYK